MRSRRHANAAKRRVGAKDRGRRAVDGAPSIPSRTRRGRRGSRSPGALGRELQTRGAPREQPDDARRRRRNRLRAGASASTSGDAAGIEPRGESGGDGGLRRDGERFGYEERAGQRGEPAHVEADGPARRLRAREGIAVTAAPTAASSAPRAPGGTSRRCVAASGGPPPDTDSRPNRIPRAPESGSSRRAIASRSASG